jgi:hypothetical protein
MTGAELEAIDFIGNDSPGTVVVEGRPDDPNAGTLYAWLVEGLAPARAIGPGEDFLYLLERARRDAADAERLLAGSTVLETRSVQLGTSDDGSIGQVSMRVGRDWVNLVHGRVVLDDASVGRPSYSLGHRDGHPTVRITGPPGARLELRAADDRPATFAPESGSVVVAGPDGPLPLLLQGFESYELQDDPTSGAPVMLAENSPGARLDITVVLEAAADDAGGVHRYDELDLLKRQSVTHVIGWNGTSGAADLADRRCLATAFANDQVTVWRVIGRCRS